MDVVASVVASAAASVVVALLLLVVALFCGDGSSLYGLPESTLHLCWDGPQAPDLTCLVSW